MNEVNSIVVLYGGVGPEREVSLDSGAAIAEALRVNFEVDLRLLDEESLPEGIDAEHSVVFPALHGTFGEDGRLQAMLDAAGIEYCGSDAAASRTCIDKEETKLLAKESGVPVIKGITFGGSEVPLADRVIEQLGSSLVLKPSNQGSSVGLTFTEHRSELGVALSQIHSGAWMIEQRVRGRELTVGVLKGAAMGIVEILSESGVYDYKAKYTPGHSDYRYPAELESKVEAKVKGFAEAMFDACGCRDFARVDFLLDGNQAYLLEVNTLPGLTATSLLPKSASCIGLDFPDLAVELVNPALARLNHHIEKGLSQ
ncbi:MAG: D-alanine--D-alanine ligase [Verrucomicrobiota bacterium]